MGPLPLSWQALQSHIQPVKILKDIYVKPIVSRVVNIFLIWSHVHQIFAGDDQLYNQMHL